jgi:hypothetical protein
MMYATADRGYVMGGHFKVALAFVAVLGTFVLASVVRAAVSFDIATGTGFVGKGEVQEAFSAWGWNNADVQANAPFLTFTYAASWGYTVVCTGAAGSTTYITVGGAFGHVITQARTNPNGKVIGFNLLGWQPGTLTPGDPESDAPEVGESCGGGTIPPGTLTSVTYNDDRFDILFVEAPTVFAPQVVWQAP